MRVILVPDSKDGRPVSEWDRLEWDDKTLSDTGDKGAEARGLFARMIAQSIQEWAETEQVRARVATSRLQREAAKEEVETEQERAKEEDDVPF